MAGPSTPSRRSISRRGPRSPPWWSAARCLRRVLVHGLPPRMSARTYRGRSTASASSTACGRHRHAALVFDGDDCVGWCQFGRPTRCPASRTARRTRRVTAPRLADRLLLRRQGPPPPGRATAALAGALDLIAGLGGGTVEGTRRRRLRTRRVPLPRCAVDLREPGFTRPQDRQAPLGHGEGRRAEQVGEVLVGVLQVRQVKVEKSLTWPNPSINHATGSRCVSTGMRASLPRSPHLLLALVGWSSGRGRSPPSSSCSPSQKSTGSIRPTAPTPTSRPARARVVQMSFGSGCRRPDTSARPGRP